MTDDDLTPLWCKNCQQRATFDGDNEVQRCCELMHLTTDPPPHALPARPYRLALLDKRFLKSIKIDPEG